ERNAFFGNGVNDEVYQLHHKPVHVFEGSSFRRRHLKSQHTPVFQRSQFGLQCAANSEDHCNTEDKHHPCSFSPFHEICEASPVALCHPLEKRFCPFVEFRMFVFLSRQLDAQYRCKRERNKRGYQDGSCHHHSEFTE